MSKQRVSYTALLISEQGLQVPHLRTLSVVFGSQCEALPRLLPVLTPTKSTTAIFPDLQEALFLFSGTGELECTDEHYTLLHNFVLAREGALTRLSIPCMKNMDILHPLKDRIAHFEVRF